MQLHTTKGIVLRTVKYGDTSIITTVYTELFGVQSYIVKGVRQSSKKSQGKAGYFQPSAILDMTVYHNEQKHLQFIKEYHWAYIYENLFFDVVKNTVALYMVELLQHTLKQPEPNPELFYFLEETLQQLDKGNNTLTANLPLYFILQLCSEAGFKIQGFYNEDTPVLDLAEGAYVAYTPNHPHYLVDDMAQFASDINNTITYTDLQNIKINRQTRRNLLVALQKYLGLHVVDFSEMKSLAILREVLG